MVWTDSISWLNANNMLVIAGICIFLAMIVGLIIYVWHIGRYKHVVEVRRIVNERSVVILDRAREFVDAKDNTKRWELLKLKYVVSEPPKQCIDLSQDGKYHTILLYRGDLDYIWTEFKTDYVNSQLTKFEPVSAGSKIEVYNQWVRGFEQAHKGLAGILEKYMPYIVLIIVGFIAFLTYDSITKHASEISASQVSISENQLKMTEALVQAQLIVNEQLSNTSNVKYNTKQTTTRGIPPN